MNSRVPRERAVPLLQMFKVAANPSIVVLALTLLGCGSDPDSPSLIASTQPSAGYGIVDEGNGGGGGDAALPGQGSEGSAEVVTSEVSAAAGGVMVCGRHTLTIPPGALKSDEQLTLLDRTAVQGHPCVQILPANIKFKTDVTLTTEVSDVQDPQTSTMYWLHSNPHGKVIWSAVGSSLSASGTGIAASLGKAGLYAVKPAS